MPMARVADRSPLPFSIHSSPPNKIGMENIILQNVGIEQPIQGVKKFSTCSAISNVSAEEEMGKAKELCRMLLEERDQLEEELVQRVEELKELCIAEGELTGQMPEEVYKTLLPGEPEPRVKTRVGTAFKFPQELIRQRENNGDEIGQLEAEIELNRRIVAAAERLANDRSANKSVRKKRRKDLQAATLRLRGLEKGLNRMRLSASKPDVSSLAENGISKSGIHAGSGFSLNSLRHWPNFYNSLRITTKSCPSTPRGSVPDLSAQIGHPPRKQTPTTTKKLHNLLRNHPEAKCSNSSADSASNGSGGCPSSSSSLSLNVPSGGSPKNAKSTTTSTSSGISSAANGSLASTSNLFLTAPPVPTRRSSAGNCAIIVRRPTPPRQRRSASRDHFLNKSPENSNSREDLNAHLYANIGYTSSAPYKSAYRQSNFPTIQSPPNRPSANSTNFSANKPIPVYYNAKIVDNQSLTAAASNQLGQIVKQLDSGHSSSSSLLLCKPIPFSGPSLSSSALPRIYRLNAPGAFSTGSLDRRAMRMAAANNTSRFMTTRSREMVHPNSPKTTFPVTETIRPLESADFARFRSISAVLDHQNRNTKMPAKDDRMEALLASLHGANRGGEGPMPDLAHSANISTSTMV